MLSTCLIVNQWSDVSRLRNKTVKRLCYQFCHVSCFDITGGKINVIWIWNDVYGLYIVGSEDRFFIVSFYHIEYNVYTARVRTWCTSCLPTYMPATDKNDLFITAILFNWNWNKIHYTLLFCFAIRWIFAIQYIILNFILLKLRFSVSFV